MVFWFGIFGEKAEEKIKKLRESIEFNEKTDCYHGDGWSIFIEKPNFCPLPIEPVWKEGDNYKLGISFHGVAVLKDTKLDEFLENPRSYLTSLLSKYKNDLTALPKEFTNGTFVGAILKPDEKTFYLFTDFFGLIPLYYIEREKHLYFSTSLYLLIRHPDIPIEWSPIGIREYLEYGTNILTETIVKNIKMLNFSSILSFSPRGLSIEYYNILPPENSRNISFKEARKGFYQLWKKKIELLSSKNIKYALALTGGIDSRLIFSEYIQNNPILAFTGDYNNHPDVILAKELVNSSDSSSKHALEAYSEMNDEQLYKSFIELIQNIDSPILMSAINFFEKIIWKKNTGMEILLAGYYGEILGGDVLHFGRSILTLIKQALFPFKSRKIECSKKSVILKCLTSILHKSEKLYPLIENNYKNKNKKYNETIESFIDDLIPFIGEVHSEEAYLERLRPCFKFSFHLHYGWLLSRNYYETLYPFLDKELVNYLLSIPIKLRAQRRLQISLLQEYYPIASNIPITSSFLKPKSPYFLHKLFSPFVTGINYGLKKRILFLQSKKFDFTKEESSIERLKKNNSVKSFIIRIIESSMFYNEKGGKILDRFAKKENYKYHEIFDLWENVWKLFCLALAEKRFTMDSQNYEKWIKKMS